MCGKCKCCTLSNGAETVHKMATGHFRFYRWHLQHLQDGRDERGGGGPGKDIVACVANEQRANGHLAWPVQHRTEAGFN